MEAVRQKPIIDVREATKVYRVGSVDVHALRGVSVSIMPGEFCCIIGRSGSGKSTLLNLLAGLEPATGGEIVINGLHLERMTQSELILFRQKNVGFIFQSFNLMPYYTALENVAFPLSFRGVPKARRDRLAKRALVDIGLGEHLRHTPGQMSGGQQQRVGIARALVTDPPIIFADEPTGNLDSTTSDEVMASMSATVRQKGKTFIMVTHDPNMAAYADKVINILDGRITEVTHNPNPARPAATTSPEGEQAHEA